MLVPEEVRTLIERFARKKDGDWLKCRAKPGDVPVPKQSDEASETPTSPWRPAIWHHFGEADQTSRIQAVESHHYQCVLPGRYH